MACCSEKTLGNIQGSDTNDPFITPGDVEINGNIVVDGSSTLTGAVQCLNTLSISGTMNANKGIFENGVSSGSSSFGGERTITLNTGSNYSLIQLNNNTSQTYYNIKNDNQLLKIYPNTSSTASIQVNNNGQVSVSSISGTSLTVSGDCVATGFISSTVNTVELNTSNINISGILNASYTGAGTTKIGTSDDFSDYTGYYNGSYQNIPCRSILNYNNGPVPFDYSLDALTNNTYFQGNASLTLRNEYSGGSLSVNNVLPVSLRYAVSDGSNTVCCADISSYVYARSAGNFCNSGLQFAVGNQSARGNVGLMKMITMDLNYGINFFPSNYSSSTARIQFQGGVGGSIAALYNSVNGHSYLGNDAGTFGISLGANGSPYFGVAPPNGSGAVINFQNQTTLGGGAGLIAGYIPVIVNGTTYKMPYYNL